MPEVYQLSDAILLRDISNVVELFNDLNISETNGFGLLSYIYNSVRGMIVYQLSKQANKTIVCEEYNVNVNFYKNAYRHANRYNVVELQEFLYRLYQLELDIKIGKADLVNDLKFVVYDSVARK